MKEHIENLKCALLSIAPHYFITPIENNKFQMLERAFSYELYHQLRVKYNNQNWFVSGEIKKGYKFHETSNIHFPDLVIHKYETTNENLIAIEIKTSAEVSSIDIIKDLKKLNSYILGCLHYRIGILIITNTDFCAKFRRMKLQNRNEISNILRANDKIQIWNIKDINNAPTNTLGADDIIKTIKYSNLC
jgi:hypothetical protein